MADLGAGQGLRSGGSAAAGSGERRRANVYVDGLNLYYGSLKGTEFRWLDMVAFCRKLVPANPINRIRYFTSRVSARQGDPEASTRQDAYLRALATFDQLSIHYGQFQSTRVRLPAADPQDNEGHRTVEVIKTEEKRSDVNLATFLLMDAFRRESDDEIAVVVSNDSDLQAPIRALIHELGVPVGLVNPHRHRCNELINLEPLFYKQVRPRALRACQLPPVLRDGQGEIRRPDGW